MKKFCLAVMTILPAVLSAHNGVNISNFVALPGSVTFDVSWDAANQPALWSDSVWVFVDYNNAGVMTRMPLAAGATLTTTSTPGVGKVIAIPNNNQGVWVVGNARSAGSFSSTVVLPSSISDVPGTCAYASNYPPVGTWNSEGNVLTMVGTPPYTLQIDGPSDTLTIISDSPYIRPDGYTPLSFTDATGAPGLLSCKPPKFSTSLAASAATICSGTSVILTATGGANGSNAEFEWGAGNVGSGILGTTTANTYLISPTTTTPYWVRCMSTTHNCGANTAATCTVAVNETSIISGPLGGSNIQTVIPNESITSISYTIGSDATSAIVAGLPAGITATYAMNTVTLEGLSTQLGVFGYEITPVNDRGCSSLPAAGTITIEKAKGCVTANRTLGTIGFKSADTYSRGSRIWSDAVTADYCNKITYNGGVYAADCRISAHGYSAETFTYMSWCMVYQYAEQLCPSPWRVPTYSDFASIAPAQPSYTVLNDWGGAQTSEIKQTGLTGIMSYGYYWSITEYNASNPWLLRWALPNEGSDLRHPDEKYFGHVLRCVQ